MHVDKALKIDKGIPLPTNGSGASYKYPWHKMKVGDSFYVDNKWSPYSMVKSYNKKLSKKYHIKIRRRLEGDGQRIWRIK